MPTNHRPPTTIRMYIELHAASAFSFLQGASLPETLVERAASPLIHNSF
jgi:DNA polymerase III alpha subunit